MKHAKYCRKDVTRDTKVSQIRRKDVGVYFLVNKNLAENVEEIFSINIEDAKINFSRLIHQQLPIVAKI